MHSHLRMKRKKLHHWDLGWLFGSSRGDATKIGANLLSTNAICYLGQKVWQEDGEMWAVMKAPDEEKIRFINKVFGLLQLRKIEEQVQQVEHKPSIASAETEKQVEEKKIDRQESSLLSLKM